MIILTEPSLVRLKSPTLIRFKHAVVATTQYALKTAVDYTEAKKIFRVSPQIRYWIMQ
jgi:hypothetical protein